MIREVGTIKQFDGVSHQEYLEKADLVDFERAVKVAGAKFVYLKNELVFLEHALIGYALETASRKGYSLFSTPEIAKNGIIEGCGFSPRDDSEPIYRLEDNESLIGTSEITLAGLHAAEALTKKQLPLKYSGVSNCFRKEAGRGKFSKGLYRLHQFKKVEMFQFTESDYVSSDKALEEIVEVQQEFFSSLGFNFKIYEMPTEELGLSAYRKIDIEAWFPESKIYGELSSASNCTDFQSVRLNTVYFGEGKKMFPHTINGTLCAIPRTVMLLVESGQRGDGFLELPNVLKRFYFGDLNGKIRFNI